MAPVTAPRLHADEVEVDDPLVAALVTSQFPEWAGRPLVRVRSSGTDNAIYRLGPDLAVRLPRIGWAVAQVARERTWLPVLGPQLPVAVPEPVAVGEPAHGYPFSWLVYRWLDGTDAMVAPVGDWSALAADVARFVGALQQVPPGDGPAARNRGALLAPHDAGVRVAIAALRDEIDVDRAESVWAEALAADPWPGPPVWVHGDLLPGNLLVEGDRLVGVIDWSATGLGDPACEAMLAWAMPPEARAVFRSTLAIDDATWARGRGWTLEQAVKFIPYYAATIPDAVAAARRRLAAVLAS